MAVAVSVNQEKQSLFVAGWGWGTGGLKAPLQQVPLPVSVLHSRPDRPLRL